MGRVSTPWRIVPTTHHTTSESAYNHGATSRWPTAIYQFLVGAGVFGQQADHVVHFKHAMGVPAGDDRLLYDVRVVDARDLADLGVGLRVPARRLERHTTKTHNKHNLKQWMNECLTTPQHEKQIGYWV